MVKKTSQTFCRMKSVVLIFSPQVRWMRLPSCLLNLKGSALDSAPPLDNGTIVVMQSPSFPRGRPSNGQKMSANRGLLFFLTKTKLVVGLGLGLRPHSLTHSLTRGAKMLQCSVFSFTTPFLPLSSASKGVSRLARPFTTHCPPTPISPQ